MVTEYMTITNERELQPFSGALADLHREAWRTIPERLGRYTPDYETNEDEWGCPMLLGLLAEGVTWHVGMGPDGRPVSCVGTKPVKGRHGSEWEVRRLVVHPEYRGRGLSEHLLRHIEGLAVSAGVYRLTLFTSSLLPALVGHYGRMGFTEYHRAPVERYGTRYDRVYLGKDLAIDSGKGVVCIDVR